MSPIEIVIPHSIPLRYRPEIDGLRAVAVLGVFLFHLDRRFLPGGFVGVDIFFAISGYLITSIILHACENNTFTFSGFYQRRIARLLAAFYIVGISTLVGASFIYSNQDLASAGAGLASAAASIANIKLMLQGNYFVLSSDAQPFLHCWSLSVEEQFYLLFPACILLLYKMARNHLAKVLAALWAFSFLICILLTRKQPEWAFYLLPTRAWELLTGAILAIFSAKGIRSPNASKSGLSLLGSACVVASLFVISEGKAFPGYWALIPVLGTAFILFSVESPNRFVERVLSWRPMVAIGRGSYSLYLWHWPVFSLVDYQWFLLSPISRLVMKVLLSAGATLFCYVLVEKPCRSFLNNPARRWWAFAAFGLSLLTLIPIGIVVRRANYVNASLGDVVSGGLHFNQSAKGRSMMLMGDSNAAMYGKMMIELAKEQDLKLNVIGVAAGDPLPHSSGAPSQLWLASFDVVKRERPDLIVLVCNWRKLDQDQRRLQVALEQLLPFVGHIIVLTQPPELPPAATRERIRAGSRPPFFEDAEERARRLTVNEVVKSVRDDNVSIVDLDPLFLRQTGEVVFFDQHGRELYQDRDHLSGVGAQVVKKELLRVARNRFE